MPIVISHVPFQTRIGLHGLIAVLLKFFVPCSVNILFGARISFSSDESICLVTSCVIFAFTTFIANYSSKGTYNRVDSHLRMGNSSWTTMGKGWDWERDKTIPSVSPFIDNQIIKRICFLQTSYIIVRSSIEFHRPNWWYFVYWSKSTSMVNLAA